MSRNTEHPSSQASRSFSPRREGWGEGAAGAPGPSVDAAVALSWRKSAFGVKAGESEVEFAPKKPRGEKSRPCARPERERLAPRPPLGALCPRGPGAPAAGKRDSRPLLLHRRSSALTSDRRQASGLHLQELAQHDPVPLSSGPAIIPGRPRSLWGLTAITLKGRRKMPKASLTPCGRLPSSPSGGSRVDLRAPWG